MPTKIRFPLIAAYFDARPVEVYSYAHLADLQSTHSPKWGLPSNMTTRTFIQNLLGQTKLSEIRVPSHHYAPLVRYVWDKRSSPLAVALSIRRDAYLSHATALRLHCLGGNKRQIFVNAEQAEKAPTDSELTQEAIRRAFQNQARQSRLTYRTANSIITVMNGKNTGCLDVQETTGPAGEHLRTTSLERTLIDIVVRPAYSGGIQAVLDAYRLARDRVSPPKIAQLLTALDYRYPYHQAVGFYMDAAGYSTEDQHHFASMEIEYDFYLGHGLQYPVFDKAWRIFYPRGLRRKSSHRGAEKFNQE
jgi:hypothetical protein